LYDNLFFAFAWFDVNVFIMNDKDVDLSGGFVGRDDAGNVKNIRNAKNVGCFGESSDGRLEAGRGIEEVRCLSRLEMAGCKSGAAVLRNGQVCRMSPPIRRRVLGGMEADYCYHVMTRTVGAERMFDAEDLEALRIIIRKMADFSGVKVMTYCLLENHWHLLVRVPSRERYLRRFEDKRNTEGELLEDEGMGEVRLMNHLTTLYSKAYMKQLQRELADLRV